MSVNDLADEIENEALSAALKAGAIKPCPFHSDVMINQGNPDAGRRAYAIATNEWKAEGQVLDRKDIMDAVKNEIEMAADECPQCMKYKDD